MALFISLTVSTLHFTIPYGFGAAARSVYYFIDIFIWSACLYTTSRIRIVRETEEKHLNSDSTRISNELGAGNPYRARVAVWTAMFLATMEASLIGTTLFCCQYVLGYAYSNEREVVHYVAIMTPLLCLAIVMDSLQAVLSGIAALNCDFEFLQEKERITETH